MAGVKFTEQAARKTAETVREYRNEARDITEPPRRQVHAMPYGFWAEITDEPSDGVYSWKRLRPKAQDTATGDTEEPLQDTDPLIEGTENAQEVEQAVGIATGARVWMQPNGYDSDGDPQFIFSYTHKAAREFRVQSVHNNYLLCKRWDGSSTTGSDVAVAKPPELRQEEYDGIDITDPVTGDTYSYSYTGAQERTVTKNGSDTQDQLITPRYIAPESGTGANFDGTLIVAVRLRVTVAGDSGGDTDCDWVALAGPRVYAEKAS